jgi:hypothetical protein
MFHRRDPAQLQFELENSYFQSSDKDTHKKREHIVPKKSTGMYSMVFSDKSRLNHNGSVHTLSSKNDGLLNVEMLFRFIDTNPQILAQSGHMLVMSGKNGPS